MSLGPDAADAGRSASCRRSEHDTCQGLGYSISADKPIPCICPCHPRPLREAA